MWRKNDDCHNPVHYMYFHTTTLCKLFSIFNIQTKNNWYNILFWATLSILFYTDLPVESDAKVWHLT